MIPNILKIVIVVFLAALMFFSCNQKSNKESLNSQLTNLTGPYLGQKPPGKTPKIFAPGVVSTELPERDLTISPDGNEIYFAVQLGQMNDWRSCIVGVKQINGFWTKPEVVSFSGQYSDIEPFIQPDGKKMYFASTRPIVEGKENKGRYSIWNAIISPDEDYLIIPSYVEDDNYGSADYYVSFRDENDNWSNLINLGEKINSPGLDFTPSISPDGKYFFFQRMNWTEDIDNKILNYSDLVNIHNGRGDIYWVDASVIKDLKPNKF